MGTMGPVADIATHAPVPDEAFEKHRGQWIAIRDGEIVAAADELDDLVADDRVEPSDRLYQVPRAASYFY